MSIKTLKPAKSRGKKSSQDKLKIETPRLTSVTKKVTKPKGVELCNPYSRCSLYGCGLVAAEVFDPDFCVHGPQGCISAVMEAFMAQGKELEFHHSGMGQFDIIYGGEKTLLANVTEAFSPYEKAGPKYVFTSCASEIIGDDVDSVCNHFNKGLPLVKVASGGVKGDQYHGINETLQGLMTKFVNHSVEKQPKMVNLIGCIGLNRHWRGDVYELVRLLNSLGVEVNRVACDSTLENLKIVGKASLTIVLAPEVGEETAQYLEKEFNIPYVLSPLFLPLGLRGVEIWLNEVGKVLSIPQEMIERLVDKEEERVRDALKVALIHKVYTEKLERLKRLPVAIIAEGSVAFSWARFVTEELGMKPVFIGLRTGENSDALLRNLSEWQKESSLSPIISFQPTVEEVKSALLETKARFIMGSSIEADLGAELGIGNFLHICNPNTHYVNINNSPFLGYTGLLNATESILNTLQN
ncbi:MAG: nitrogenase component 1 [Desulfobulbaceae bacterium]|nr:nitrogenase component 1 [Desulfobulbaceae bacterium]